MVPALHIDSLQIIKKTLTKHLVAPGDLSRSEGFKGSCPAAALWCGPGLKGFLSILKEGILVAKVGRLGLQSWSRSQIESVVTVAEVIVSACLSISVDLAKMILAEIIKKSLKLSLCSLEKLSFDGSDFTLQNDCLHVLEMSLILGYTRDYNATKSGSLKALTVIASYPSSR